MFIFEQNKKVFSRNECVYRLFNVQFLSFLGNRPRVAQRRTYRLRNPERGTQTYPVQKPPSTKLDSCVQVNEF